MLMGHLAWSHQGSDKHGNLVSKYPPVDLKYFTSLMPKLVLISMARLTVCLGCVWVMHRPRAAALSAYGGPAKL